MHRMLDQKDNSGLFVRIRRDNSYDNFPLEDLSPNELTEYLENKNEVFLASGIKHLINYINELKDQLHHRVKE